MDVEERQLHTLLLQTTDRLHIQDHALGLLMAVGWLLSWYFNRVVTCGCNTSEE
jgi:hypothetical protein